MLLIVDKTTIQGMHLMIIPALDFGVFVLESIG